jgi:hypothetical protein
VVVEETVVHHRFMIQTKVSVRVERRCLSVTSSLFLLEPVDDKITYVYGECPRTKILEVCVFYGIHVHARGFWIEL